MHGRIPNLTPAERRIRREARSAALRDLALALRQGGKTFAIIGQELGLSLERARQIVKKAERLANAPRWYDNLPSRAIGILYARGLLDCPEHEAALALAQVSTRELMQTPNFGQVSLNALRAWLADHGRKLCPESAHAFARRMRGSPTKSGAPMRERPSVSETGPSQAGRNKDETPCLYTTKAT